MKVNRRVHVIYTPEHEDKLNKHLAGYHAFLHKKKFNPHESIDWKEGYERASRGESLKPYEIRYILR